MPSSSDPPSQPSGRGGSQSSARPGDGSWDGILGHAPVGMFLADVTACRRALEASRVGDLAFEHASDMLSLLAVEPGGELRFVRANARHRAAIAAVSQGGEPLSAAGRLREEVLIELGFSRATIDAETARYREAIQTREAVRFEWRPRIAGQDLVFETVISPIVDEDGECSHVLWAGRDVTARRRIEADLAASRERLSEAQALARIGSWTLDLHTNELHWSDEIYRIFEIDAARFGASCEAFLAAVHPADHELVDETYRHSVETREAYAIKHRLLMGGGRVKYVFERGRTEYAEDGTPLRSIGIVQDVTQQHEIEQALRASEEQLRQASKLESLGRLAGGIAHDFNNLLTVILGYTELIDEDPASTADGIGEIRRAAERARDLTQQMLAFARKQLVMPEVLSLNQQVLRFERLLRRALGEEVHLRVGLAGGLWNIKADPGQIEQVLLNLALNARDAMPDGGNLELRTSNVGCYDDPAVEPGPYVCLEVRDSGTGMPAETLEHCFEPFFTTRGVGEGTGLGLATVYGIVKQSRGHITVESSPGEGTRFRAYFPRAAGPAPARLAHPQLKPATGRETVLVVEDEPMVLRVTVRALASAGYTVLTATSGREALEVAQSVERIDLLVSDVVMPQMRGPEVAAALRRQWPVLPVLFVSGYAREDSGGTSPAELGRTLVKPFTNATLLGEVRAMLDGAGAR